MMHPKYSYSKCSFMYTNMIWKTCKRSKKDYNYTTIYSTNQENWPNVFPYMTLYCTNVLARANAGLIFLVCRVVDVQPATFIKIKSPQTRAFIVIFKGDFLPYSIFIQKERQDTTVFMFRNKLLMCNNCHHKFGHAKKWCKQDGTTCRRCSAKGHAKDQCNSETTKFLHCGGRAYGEQCPMWKASERRGIGANSRDEKSQCNASKTNIR